jgi:5-methylcytosine-specific restriction enzyme B
VSVMKIFAGSPGTGKTWRAAREAVKTLFPDATEADMQQLHQNLVREGRIIWVTFHPSYTYEDFVEGYRPQELESGNIVYQVVPGPFLLACNAASSAVSANRFSVGQRLGKYRIAHVESGGLVLESDAVKRKDRVAGEDDAPGRMFVDFWSLREFEKHHLSASDLRLHGKMNDRRQEVSRLTGLPTTWFTNSSRHAAVYEALQQDAFALNSKDVVLVIDEINRADISRVFGELITLLDHDKRQGATEERQVLLTYSRRPLSVPANLSIIGTMNTADKSLTSVDLALRRRFEFVAIGPDPSLVPDNYGGIDVRELFTELNRRLAAVNGPDLLIGHSDFMADGMEEARRRWGFEQNSSGRAATVASLLRTKTLPFLDDLFRGDRGLVRFALGADLFEETPVNDLNDELIALGRPETEAAIAASDWWDPGSPKWSVSDFVQRYPAV